MRTDSRQVNEMSKFDPSVSLDNLLYHVKLQILEESRPLLCKNLQPKRHYAYLRSVNILSEDDCAEINHEVTPSSQAGKFLDILQKRGPTVYYHLCQALLKEGSQLFLLRHLNEEFERRRALVIAENPHLVPASLASEHS
ncbi:uncharacterized protein LOC106171096 [Lingula anatina]|uniref:Uncharacterized protein LOC106171096 n=1 Tax=Lingula anatina TaxID=7574 RepID=A0A1S3J8Q0_LINAN|nr:uncharacterized protein LOC106171096 [Lingula anatina]|eukprot:XP_013406688.1 uncharacterized protein LOC106171096 [Lingula anatina]